MRRWRWLALSLLCAARVAAGDGITATRAQQLQNLLTQDCGSCHGLQMKGGLGPALRPQNLVGKSPQYLSQVILYGRAGSAMPPWNGLLTAAEARWMADRLLHGETP